MAARNTAVPLWGQSPGGRLKTLNCHPERSEGSGGRVAIASILSPPRDPSVAESTLSVANVLLQTDVLRRTPCLCPPSLFVYYEPTFSLLSMWPLLKRIAEANSCLAGNHSTSHRTIVLATLASLPNSYLSTTSNDQSTLQPHFEPKGAISPVL